MPKGGKPGYRPSLHTTKLHKERTEFEENYQGHGEAEVVARFQLAEVLAKFVAWWELEYPDDGQWQNQFIGPMKYIEEESERCATKVNTRYLSRILHDEQMATVPLSKAEAVLLALGKENLLRTGEIRVVPNPHWSLEKWMNYMGERGCI